MGSLMPAGTEGTYGIEICTSQTNSALEVQQMKNNSDKSCTTTRLQSFTYHTQYSYFDSNEAPWSNSTNNKSHTAGTRMAFGNNREKFHGLLSQ